jgi:hypothetical protein
LVFSKAHPTRQFHNAGSRRRYRQCARNSGGTTGNSCYTFISSKSAFGLDRTGLDWTGLNWTALVPSTHETFPRRVPFIYFFSSVPWYDFTRISGESRSQHFFTFFSFLSRLTYSLLTVFQALAWVGAWVIGVLCAMESIGRSSADRYTFFSSRQLVLFFLERRKGTLFHIARILLHNLHRIAWLKRSRLPDFTVVFSRHIHSIRFSKAHIYIH